MVIKKCESENTMQILLGLKKHILRTKNGFRFRLIVNTDKYVVG